MFEELGELISFIVSIFQTVVDGIWGCISVITSIIKFVNSIIYIFPTEIYSCLLFFVSLYLVIVTYKILRKG